MSHNEPEGSLGDSLTNLCIVPRTSDMKRKVGRATNAMLMVQTLF